jgi:hypothetical protein
MYAVVRRYKGANALFEEVARREQEVRGFCDIGVGSGGASRSLVLATLTVASYTVRPSRAMIAAMWHART